MRVLFRDINLNWQKIARASLMLSMLALSVSCKKETLDPLTKADVGIYNYGAVDAHFCTSAPSPALQKLKYLFIVDHSASNKPGVTADATDVQNSDASGSRRYGTMINFLSNLSPDPNTLTSFGLIDFNDTAAQATGLNGFESNTATFIQLATADWVGTGTNIAPSPVDSGFTNYQAALDLAEQMITADAQNEAAVQTTPPITTVYQIIFVSDGTPTVQSAGSGSLYTQQFGLDIQPVISRLLDLKNHSGFGSSIANVNINTAYYFSTAQAPNANAVTLLQQMANAGNGLFIQFASGQQILYQQFAPPSRRILNQLADVFVENENAVWWDDGRFMLDSDGDGLPDAIEDQFGSNPNAADSDGNGVSDLVEFRTKGRPCDNATCSATGRDLYAICAGFNPSTSSSGQVLFSSTANDGLNDCEKFLLNGNSQSFNSNGSFIPDFLSFKNTISIQSGNSNVALSDPFGDGVNNYSKLKSGLPIQVSKHQILYFNTRVTSLTPESSPSNDVNCYHLTVANVALAGPQNKIRISIIQNSSSVQDKAFLMTAEKSFNSQLNVSFQAGDFK